MEIPENREGEDVKFPQTEALERVKLTRNGEHGVRCPWCKIVGKNHVRKNYPQARRKRFCEACRREFLTYEEAI